MSHTYVQNVIHVVFSTKERRKQIPGEMKERFWSYMVGVCRHERIFVHAIGGMEDHAHLLLQIPPTMALADGVREIKTNSSSWMKEFVDDFAWQQGYSGFGVSKSNIPTVVRYIKNQERHHRKMTFEEEFRALLEKHGIEFDPKYMFG